MNPWLQAVRVVASTPLAEIGDEEEGRVRGAALSALAALLAAAPPPLRDASAPGVMVLLAEGLADTLRETVRQGALRGITQAAETLGASISPFVPHLLPLALLSARPPNGLEELVYGQAFQDVEITQQMIDAAFAMIDAAFAEASSGNGTSPDEAAAGMRAISALARAAPAAVRPHLAEAAHVAAQLAIAYQPCARTAAIQALASLGYAAVKDQPPSGGGLPAKQSNVLDNAISVCLVALSDDDDKTTVAAACDALGDMCAESHWRTISSYLPQVIFFLIAKRVRRLMEGKALCTQSAAVESPVREEGDQEAVGSPMREEGDQEVFAAATRLLCTLAASWGEARRAGVALDADEEEEDDMVERMAGYMGVALDAGEEEEDDMVERMAGTDSRGKKRGGEKTGPAGILV
ncbi:hypothetical protein T484DRAFT_1824708 [Baffinella frigidus]|nr:hypothetical protein T484DRAFT_1824708 [Cryptophyta sp. CCMP2293]